MNARRGTAGSPGSAIGQAQGAAGHGTAHQPTVVAHSHPGEDCEQIEVSAPAYRSSSVVGMGGDRQVIEGDTPLNEQDVQQVCDTLHEALAIAGESWGRFDLEREPNDVDAVAQTVTGILSRFRSPEQSRRPGGK